MEKNDIMQSKTQCITLHNANMIHDMEAHCAQQDINDTTQGTT